MPNAPPSIPNRGEGGLDPRLVAFLAVARTGQLTQASKRLNLAASSVSAQIASLERDLQAVLFLRGSRGMDLTASGAALLQTAEQMEALWNKTLRDVRAEQEGAARVGIAASNTVAELFLPQPLGRFRDKWPETRIRLLMTNSQEVVERVADGTVDIGIIEGAVTRGALYAERLWTDELVLILSVRHPWARRPSIQASELSALDWILREEGSGTRRVFEQALERAGFSVHGLNVMMQLSSLRSIVAMVANNVGVSVVSQAVLDSAEIQISGVASIPVEGLDLHRTLEVVTAGPDLPLRAAQLVEQLRLDVRIRQKRL